MRIAIIQFPGSNCESESIRAVRRAGMNPVEYLWNEDYQILEGMDGYFIVGGFSYEDRSRSGIISAMDPVIRVISNESQKGKPVLGICNGAQILVETGLVPGLMGNAVGMALAVNKRVKDGQVLGTGFYNTWVQMMLDVPNQSNAFSRHLEKGQSIRVPIAHGEGRFLIPDELLKEMIDRNMTAFRYANDQGEIVDEFPINPNGAVYNLSAVTNKEGNVMAMMPHPERTPAGDPIFSSMREYIEEAGHKITVSPLSYTPPAISLHKYEKPESAEELIVEQIITDNVAGTVGQTLKQLGIDVSIKRYIHWELQRRARDTSQIPDFLFQISGTGELFNSNKERLVDLENLDNFKTTIRLLVRYKDDFEGQNKCDTLHTRFGLDTIVNITKGILWEITPAGNIDEAYQTIMDSHILFNQYSQLCLLYDPR